MKIKQILTEATISRHDLDRLKTGMAQMLDKLERAIDFRDTGNKSLADENISSLINSILWEKEAILKYARTQEDLDAALEAEQKLAREVQEHEQKRLQSIDHAKAKMAATKGSTDWANFKKFVLSDKLKLPANGAQKGDPRRIISVTPKNIDVLRPNGTIVRTAIEDLTTPEYLDEFAKRTTNEVTADFPNYANYINGMRFLNDEAISYRWRDLGGGFKLQIDDQEFNRVYNIAVFETGGGGIQFTADSIRFFNNYRQEIIMEFSFDQISEIKHIGEMYSYLADKKIIDGYRSIKDVRPVGTGSILFNIYGLAADINSADIHSAGDLAKEIFVQTSKIPSKKDYY